LLVKLMPPLALPKAVVVRVVFRKMPLLLKSGTVPPVLLKNCPSFWARKVPLLLKTLPEETLIVALLVQVAVPALLRIPARLRSVFPVTRRLVVELMVSTPPKVPPVHEKAPAPLKVPMPFKVPLASSKEPLERILLEPLRVAVPPSIRVAPAPE